MAALARLLLPLTAALALAACMPTVTTPEPRQTPLVWPPAPDAPRIAFVRSFSRPEDLGIRRSFLQKLGDLLFGKDDARLVKPMAVVAVGDLIYVADPGAGGVHRFDTKEGDYDLIRDEEGRPLPSPVGLARGGAGEVYVTDSELAQVFVIRPGARDAQPLALRTPLQQPTGIAYDAATGRLFVVDTAAHRVEVFARDGSLAESFGGRGRAQGQFNYPTLAWRSPQGTLYVTDTLNFRVQMFDAADRFAGTFGALGDGSGDLPRQKGVATDSFGHIYIADALFNAVQVFDASGRFLLSLGALGRERGEFWLPTGVFIDETDRLYVADSFNHRVQVFRYVGGAT